LARALVGAAADAAERELQALGPAAEFGWHTQQEYALRAATDIILVVGGNRSGKSQVGVGICSRLVRREGPIYRRLRNPRGRALTIWVAPQTDEKAKSLWEPRLLKWCEGLNATYTQAPHRVIRWSDADGGGSIWIKSQEQGFMSFESDDVDLVLFDEEPEDRRVYASAKTRLATTNGVVALTFTPLNGMTWTFDELFEPVASKPQLQIADRVWRQGNELTVIQMGMADNPEAVAGGGVARMQADPGISVAEKNARLYGVYGFTEGLLFPMWADLKAEMQFSPYLLERLPRDRPYLWYLTADPNKRHGALLTAVDGHGNQIVCAEHYAEGIPDSAHAEGYRAMLAEFRVRESDIQAFADPGGAGAQAIINLAEVGFFAQPVPKDPGSVAASIKRLRRLASLDRLHPHPVTEKLGAPHIYFLRTLRSQWQTAGHKYDESRLFWELRQYRQKPDAAPDTPIKRFDDVVDPLRYLQLAHAEGAEFEVFDAAALERAKLDPLSRQEAEKYDRMVRQLEAESARRRQLSRH
jgi:phage terminase large subunit-like protein